VGETPGRKGIPKMGKGAKFLTTEGSTKHCVGRGAGRGGEKGVRKSNFSAGETRKKRDLRKSLRL